MLHENDISGMCIKICFNIHNRYGPGLYESVYDELFAHELCKSQLPFTRQQPIPLIHEDLKLNIGFRSDFIINNKVIIEIKSVESLAPVHFKQLQTYLKLSGIKLGLLINFNVNLIKEGIHRIANKL